MESGLGLYASNPYLAILIEALFSIVVLWYFFREEAKKGIIRTTKNRIANISVFAYGIIFILLIATKSFRQLFSIPEFYLGFNTNMPTIIFTYGAMLYCLNYFVLKFTLDKKTIKKTKKIFNWIFKGLILSYILLICFPHLLFANKLEYTNFSVYYHSNDFNTEELKLDLDKSENLLKKSELFKNGINQDIFICSSCNEFTFFCADVKKSIW